MARDRAPLEALVAFQQEVVFGYTVALRQGPFTAREKDRLRKFLSDTEQAAAALRAALGRAGGKAPPAPDAASRPPPSTPGRSGYLADLITAEDALVSSYYLAMQSLADERQLEGAATFMAQAGRRLVVLRYMDGRELLPRSFETGGA